MSLEIFAILAEEEYDFKKTQHEVLVIIIGVERGLGKISNQSTDRENKV